MDDHKAIARLKQGHIDGLDSLMQRYQVRALRTAYLITQDAALAEDVVQDAFVSVYRSIHTFDSGRPFAPWLMRIVAHGAIRAARRDQRSQPLDAAGLDYGDALVDPAPGPDGVVESAETEEAVWAALGELLPERRAAIVLKFYLELSDAEIAEQLSIPVGTVKSRVFAAKKHLRKLLKEA